MRDEQRFFDDCGVLVTSARIEFPGGKTFATANVTSVSTEVVQPPKQSAGCQTLLIVAGVLGALFSLVVMQHGAGTGLLLLLLIGGAPIALGVWWLTKLKPPLPTHVINISSASGEVEGMRSTDRQLIEHITGAIKDAIVARG